MAKVKICGLRRDEDIDYVNELKPDYIGYILSPGFRRSIDRETALRLSRRLSPDIKAVGVFINDSVENINYFLKNNIISLVQLHGSESAEFCKAINAPVIKFFKPESFDKIDDYNGCAGYFLFDSGTGTGNTFDWAKLPKTNKPFFLAGGLDSTNIPQAIEKINPYCLDLSSSAETDGVKDYNKIKEILECVRNE
ncbi:MAG: phosphoribosylanthranilate isomerase [Clostridiales bacterium]|nr:phosphoribosylanthranilate isomerase [Clostridiales bacterium]